MVAVLAHDDLGGHAGVVAVPLDQAAGARGLPHAALRMVRAGVLRVLGDADPQFRPLELQRLGLVVTDDLAFAVLRAMLLGLGRFGRHFVTGQVLGCQRARKPSQ